MARLGQSLKDVEGIILMLPSRRLTDETISTTEQKCTFNQTWVWVLPGTNIPGIILLSVKGSVKFSASI